MEKSKQFAVDVLDEIKQHSLECNLDQKKHWDNSYIKKQIHKRRTGYTFDIEDHIRAMIYAMLSSGRRWDCVLSNVDNETGILKKVDEIFYNCNSDKLLKTSHTNLLKRVLNENLGNPYIEKQILALQENIKILKAINEKYTTIDEYYMKINKNDETFWNLVNALANTKANKLHQLGVPLTCEYLRNIGYDIGKPDRHVCRIVSNEYLGLSDKNSPSYKEVYMLLLDIRTDKWTSAAEIDYYLWAFCTSGYIGGCTLKDLQCEKCVLSSLCNKYAQTNINIHSDGR